VTVTTDYPFQNTLAYTVVASKAFTFNVRIPAWAQTSGKSTISVNNSAAQPVSVDTSTNFHAVSCAVGTTKFTVDLDAPITTEIGVNNSVSVHRGALMYAIDLTYQEQTHPALRLISILKYTVRVRLNLVYLGREHLSALSTACRTYPLPIRLR
jgi:DUF1680 family protein